MLEMLKSCYIIKKEVEIMNETGLKLCKKVKEEERNRLSQVEQDKWRLKHHIMAPVAWINDPNGLCFFKGYYHIFFQYSPFDAKGGDKYWGHYRSKDLLHFEYLGTPFAPDESFDRNGVFSGSAFVKEDEMHIFYTGNVEEEGDYDYTLAGRGANVIHVVSKDGETFSKKQCVLTNKDYPSYYTCHIRDPKLWEENGTYYMVLGGRDRKDKGRILIYQSTDLYEWRFLNDITTKKQFGFMWECPDTFSLEGTGVLACCPQGLPCYEYQYENVDQAGYFLFEDSLLNRKEVREESFIEWDMGFDFYAPQSFLDEKGRRILIGWMGLPSCDYWNPTVENGWQHNLTVPRELSIKNNRIYQWPVEELKELRGKEISLAYKKGQGYCWESEELQAYEVIFQNKDSSEFDIEISEGLHICYEKEANEVRLYFNEENDAIGYGRTSRKVKVDKIISGRILVDTSVVELFLNDGEYVLSTRYYPKKSGVRIHEAFLQVKIYELNEIEVSNKIR